MFLRTEKISLKNKIQKVRHAAAFSHLESEQFHFPRKECRKTCLPYQNKVNKVHQSFNIDSSFKVNSSESGKVFFKCLQKFAR